MSTKQQRIATFVGLFIALGLPFLLDLAFGKHPEDMAIPSRMLLTIAEKWALALVLLSIVFFWEHQSPGSINDGTCPPVC